MERLADLKPDPQNPRRHGERNVAVVRDSIAGDGFGRSLLLANDGTIIAGNATARAAAEVGLERVRVVETDGTEVVAVKRTDVAPDSPAFRRLSVADNRGAELAEWDAAILAAHAEAGVLDPDAYWNDDEWARMLATFAEEPPFDPAAAWQGMPEFHQDDQMPVKQVIVNFASEAAVEAFGRVTEQDVTMTTKSVWYPARQTEHRLDRAYVVTDDADAA